MLKFLMNRLNILNEAFAIDDDFVASFCPIIEMSSAKSRFLLNFARVHKSFLNERSDIFESNGIRNTHLEFLNTLGKMYLQSCIYTYIWIETPPHSFNGSANLSITLKNTILNKCKEENNIEKYVLLGKGESQNSLSNNLIENILYQLFAAIKICSNYNNFYCFLKQYLRSSINIAPSSIDTKSMLQELLQKKKLKTPKYSLIEETGPDHDKSFKVRVITGENKIEEGTGRSKKIAEQNAAYRYLVSFESNYIKSKLKKAESEKITAQSNRNHFNHIAPKRHIHQVIEYLHINHFNQKNLNLICQAFTHSSFTNETKKPQHKNSDVLAQIGSYLFQAYIYETIAFKICNTYQYLIESTHISRIAAEFTNSDTLASLFDQLELKPLLLLGEGQKKVGITEKMKSDAFQGLLAAFYLANKNSKDFNDFIPKSIISLLNSSVDKKLSSLNSESYLFNNSVDPKSRLQEILQRLKLSFKYLSHKDGLDHQRWFKSTLRFNSELLNSIYLFSTHDYFDSKMKAEKAVASQVLKIFYAANNDVSNPILKNDTSKQIAYIFLIHEFREAPETVSLTKKWLQISLLGSNLLSGEHTHEFIKWAEYIENCIFKEQEIPYLSNLSKFYSNLRYLNRQRNENIEIDRFNFIKTFLDKLNPDNETIDVINSSELKHIIKLSKVSKLRSKGYTETNLLNVFEDVCLLRRNKSIGVVLQCEEILIREREGIYHTLFEEILKLFDKLLNYQHDKITISISPDSKNSILKIHFISENNKLTEIGEILRSEDPLFLFFRNEIPFTNIHFDNNSITISCLLTNSDTLASKLLRSYYTESTFNMMENIALSRILHDLKNELLAYHIRLENKENDITSVLKAKFEASKHLDSALKLCFSMQTLQKTLSEPEYTLIEIKKFIDNYISQTMVNLPSNISFVPPKTTGDYSFYCSRDYLYSIINNLIKNSVDALTEKGGEIILDWIYDEEQKKLLLQVQDNGPGANKEVLNVLNSGEATSSIKEKGSGIGVFTVHSMLRKIGGSIVCESKESEGIIWTIEIPSYEINVSQFSEPLDDNKKQISFTI